MGTTATFTAELLGDGHLSIPEKVVKALSLKKGEKVKAVIEAEKFDKEGFLALSGIWKDKSADTRSVYTIRFLKCGRASGGARSSFNANLTFLQSSTQDQS